MKVNMKPVLRETVVLLKKYQAAKIHDYDKEPVAKVTSFVVSSL